MPTEIQVEITILPDGRIQASIPGREMVKVESDEGESGAVQLLKDRGFILPNDQVKIEKPDSKTS